MDALTSLLDGPRARGAFLMRSILEPPWSLRIQDGAPLALVAVVRGGACVVPDDEPPAYLGPGDVAVIHSRDPYTVADPPDTPPQALILPGGESSTLDGEPLCEAMSLGVRTWGHSPDGSTTILCGTYYAESEISGRLLGALPMLAVLRRDTWDYPLVPLLAEEMRKDDPGQETVLDRLLDLLLITALRAWFARPDAGAPAWYAAGSDPVVGEALRLLHNNPDHPWTVASLAGRVGVSRATLARRFTDLVGEPPMAYLGNWRLELAADLLRGSDATIGAVARKVGYGSSFALSAAFKRVRGVSPQQYRTGAAA